MAYNHGVYVTEAPTSLAVPTEGTAGLQVVFGTAPIYQVDDISKITEPKLCYSYDEAVAAVGYSDDFDAFTLCQSIKASFDLFSVAPIILVNALDPANSNHVTTVSSPAAQTIANNTFVVSADSVPVPYVIKATLKVLTNSTGGTELVEDVDYTCEYASNGLLTITMISDAAQALTTAYVTYKAIAVTDGKTAVTTAEIVTAINKVREIYPRFGLTAGLLLAPGWSTDANVAAKLQSSCEGINGNFSAECIIDISSGPGGATDYQSVKTVKENAGLTSAHAISVWPKWKSGDYVLDASAALGALIAYTDANNGDTPNLSPSNKPLSGITGTVLADGTEVVLDQEQANLINSYGVVTALNLNGYRAWGNNTCAYPASTDPKDRWIMVRRFFTWRANSLILSYFQKVDDPANYRLIESIADAENITGNSFVAAGVCAGYLCEFREAENPITQILDGEIVFHLSLAPYTPAESIEFILEFNPTYIESALTGGE